MKAKIMQDVIFGIPVPDCVELREIDLPFWKRITEARAIWNDLDLVQAANLARCLADTQILQKKIEAEMALEKPDRKQLDADFKLMDVMTRRSTALARSIHVHTGATVGKADHNDEINKAKRQAVESVKEVQVDHDLLARPSVN